MNKTPEYNMLTLQRQIDQGTNDLKAMRYQCTLISADAQIANLLLSHLIGDTEQSNLESTLQYVDSLLRALRDKNSRIHLKANLDHHLNHKIDEIGSLHHEVEENQSAIERLVYWREQIEQRLGI
jgi:flagellar biosynthesis/type III secretory pathway protein FliH